MINHLKLTLFALLLFLISPVIAQNTEEEPVDPKKAKGTRAVYWAEAGFGFSSQAWSSQLSVNLELFNNIVLTAGYENSSRGDERPYKSFYEHSGFFGGLGLVNKKGMALKMVSVGVSQMDYTIYSYQGQNTIQGLAIHEISTKDAMGVRIEGRIIPNNGWVGLAFSPFININSVNTFVGANVSIALGRMW
jgi:hypothetical protein